MYGRAFWSRVVAGGTHFQAWKLRMNCLPAFINNHKLGQICQTRRDAGSMESRLGAAQIKVYHNISSITLSENRCGSRLMTICRYMAHDNRLVDLLWPWSCLPPPALYKQTRGGEKARFCINKATYSNEHSREICMWCNKLFWCVRMLLWPIWPVCMQYACLNVCVFVCMHARMCNCMHLCVSMSLFVYALCLFDYTCVCVYTRKCMYMHMRSIYIICVCYLVIRITASRSIKMSSARRYTHTCTAATPALQTLRHACITHQGFMNIQRGLWSW